jgi:hypothetical protein
MMRALSLTQPWASAIAHEIKRWETRSWPTHVRGEICIHSSRGFPKWAQEFADLESIEHRVLGDLPLGYILCVCNLTECRQTETLAKEISELEKKWGAYDYGRFGFKIENVRVLSEPIPVRGSLGFWKVPSETEKLIRERLRNA